MSPKLHYLTLTDQSIPFPALDHQKHSCDQTYDYIHGVKYLALASVGTFDKKKRTDSVTVHPPFKVFHILVFQTQT